MAICDVAGSTPVRMKTGDLRKQVGVNGVKYSDPAKFYEIAGTLPRKGRIHGNPTWDQGEDITVRFMDGSIVTLPFCGQSIAYLETRGCRKVDVYRA